MMSLAHAVVLSGAIWSGTAEVEVMNWEGGGEHPYKTTFELRYREDAPIPLRDGGGRLVGKRIPLLAEMIALKVQHEVRGLLNCTGTGEEIVTGLGKAELVVPLRGESLASIVGFDAPSNGAYQLVLPRAYGAFACGHSVRNKNDRGAGVGKGLFSSDVEFWDRGPRALEASGSRMRGSYEYRRERSADGSVQQLVTKEIHVKWDLVRSQGGP